jgi:hypothetical protein
MTSANGRGRTLYEILMGLNKRDMRPLELQYHNPLGAKVGCTVAFEHEPEIAGINFVVESISVYKTMIRSKAFFHTDYHLKGVSLDSTAPVRLRLRLIADENVENGLGHRVQLLYLYDKCEYNKELHEVVLADPSGEFWVQKDDDGNDLAKPRQYWRVEDVLDPYNARLTVLKDVDGDGTIEDEELEHKDVVYWDYSRLTENPLTGTVDLTEFLTVEMDKKDGYFIFLRGTEVLPSQISVY